MVLNTNTRTKLSDKVTLFVVDGVQPKISPMISFSGMYQKQSIYRRNRRNSQKELEFIFRSERSDCTYVYG